MKIEFFTEGDILLPFQGISFKYLKSSLKKICKYLELKNVVISIVLCDNKYIQNINKNYRNKNKSTDVISFSYRENPFPDIKLNPEQLGDIYISLEKAMVDACVFGIKLKEEINRLLVHGVLHLVGYDHERSKKEEKIMREKEDAILNFILD